MARGSRRNGGRLTRLALLTALLAPLAAPSLTGAQDAPSIVPVVSAEAVAVIADEGASVDPSLAPVEAAPVAAPAESVPDLAPAPAAPPVAMAPSAPADWAPPTTVYIAESGHSVDGLFLDVWRAWGGALSWGNPITPEFEENGRVVQYYGFGRFEWAPNDPNGEVVQFGDLGAAMRPFMIRRTQTAESAAVASAAEAARAWIPLDQAPAVDSEVFRFVPETGHSIRDEMLAFWVQTGETSYLGNPISEPYAANGLTYQMFERGTVVQEPGGWPYVLPIGELLATRYGLDMTPAPQGDLPTYAESLWTPPAPPAVGAVPEGVRLDPNGERRVLINLGQQYLWAYQGDA
ncbi:MAG: hypothetical protein H0U10_15520, partial [Chloroflexia bacterium]|nr:hypothetical protein [Chloroflexia bacterium]